jgi:DNA-binding transcriptional ArsR family regulator
LSPKRVISLVLLFVITFSSIAFLQLQKNNPLSINSADNLALTTFPSQPVFGDIVKQTQPALISNSTRTEIYNFVVANPGIQFRGICTGLSIAIGTAEFHLGILKKAGLISFVRDGKYKRFFATKVYLPKEMILISLLRHGTVREILKTLSSEKTVSHCKLASKLSITSQGLTWQMNKLRDQEIIQETRTANKVSYSINEDYLQNLPDLLSIATTWYVKR